MKSGTFIRTLMLGSAVLMTGLPLIAASRMIDLDRPDGLDLRGVKAENVEYQGRKALRLAESGQENSLGLAILKGVTFRDGTIDLEVSGAPAKGAGEGARGFIGIAFRVGPDAKQFEYFYLRPTNGRADDQVRRNHSVQYASHPDYPWPRLRKEEPEKYESYVDLEPGVWTKMRIVVSGTKAKLYVHGTAQPVLVVNDLKMGLGEGGIALWIGPGTEGHFTNLTVSGE
jgi:hypothetical protein